MEKAVWLNRKAWWLVGAALAIVGLVVLLHLAVRGGYLQVSTGPPPAACCPDLR